MRRIHVFSCVWTGLLLLAGAALAGPGGTYEGPAPEEPPPPRRQPGDPPPPSPPPALAAPLGAPEAHPPRYVDPEARGYVPVRARRLERVAWTFRAGRNVGRSVPLPDGTLRVMAGGGNVHSIDASTGASRWAAGGNTRFWNYSAPAVAETGVAFGGNHTWVSAISPKGEILWRTDLAASWIHHPPVLSPDEKTLYLGADGLGLAALDTANGGVRWLRRDFRGPWTPMTFDSRGRLVAGLPDRIACFERDGRETWSVPGRASSLLATDALLLVARANVLEGLDASTRAPRFRADLGARIQGFALGDDDRVRVTLADGALADVDLDGRVRWRRTLAGSPLSPPLATLGGECVVVDAGGTVRVLDSNGFEVSALGTGGPGSLWRPSVGAHGRVFVDHEDALLCCDGTTRPPPAPVRATSMVVVADDFVVDVWLDGRLVPLDHRHMLGEAFGATTERIDLDVRTTDFLVFHVVANRLRWGGSSYFAVCGTDAAGRVAFVSRPGPPWFACDDVRAVPDFSTKKEAGLDRPAVAPARPWGDGPRQFVGRIPGRFDGAPVWGTSASTWIKFLATPDPEGTDDESGDR